MANLGTPYRIYYEAKGLQSGLTDVRAVIVKPNSVLAGVFPMTELPFASFQGVYYCDLITSPGDPAGEWVGSIYSPTQNIRSTLRISMQPDITLTIQAMVQNFLANGIREELSGYVLSNELHGETEAGLELIGFVSSNDVVGESEESETETTGTAEDASDIEGDTDGL